MVISHNLGAAYASRQLNITTGQSSKSTEKLSSGYKINRAADDAAGLSISEKMRKKIRGLNVGEQNIQDGISLTQIADGALNETHAMLQRMNELAVQAANGTNSATDRQAIENEINELKDEIDRISETTSFNDEIYPLRGNEETVTNYIIQIDDSIEESRTSEFNILFDSEPSEILDEVQRIRDYLGINYIKETYIEITLRESTDENGGLWHNGNRVQKNTTEYVRGLTLDGNVPNYESYNSLNFVMAESTGIINKDVEPFWDGYFYDIGITELNTDDEGYLYYTNHYGETRYLIIMPWNEQDIALQTIHKKNDEQILNDGGSYVVSNIKNYENEEISRLTIGKINGSVNNDAELPAFLSLYNFSFVNDFEDSITWDNIDYEPGETIEGSIILYDASLDPDSEERYKNMKSVSYFVDDNNFGTSFYYNGEDSNEMIKKTLERLVRDGHKGYSVVSWEVEPESNDNIIRFNSSNGKYAYLGGETFTRISQFTAKMDSEDEWFRAIVTNGNINNNQDNNQDNNEIDISNRRQYLYNTVSRMSIKNLKIQGSDEIEDCIFVHTVNASSKAIGIGNVSVLTEDSATNSIDLIAAGIKKISEYRSYFGAMQNRFEHASRVNANTAENTTAAESRIRDTDMASEMVKHSKENILLQAGQSVLTQANQSTSGVLSLMQ